MVVAFLRFVNFSVLRGQVPKNNHELHEHTRKYTKNLQRLIPDKGKLQIPSQNNLVPLKSVLIDDYHPRFIFSQRAADGMKRSNKAFNKGRVQDVDEPCNTVNSHLAKISLNGTDPVLLVDAEKEIYRRFTPLEAARIQSFPDNFIFPVSEFQAYK